MSTPGTYAWQSSSTTDSTINGLSLAPYSQVVGDLHPMSNVSAVEVGVTLTVTPGPPPGPDIQPTPQVQPGEIFFMPLADIDGTNTATPTLTSPDQPSGDLRWALPFPVPETPAQAGPIVPGTTYRKTFIVLGSDFSAFRPFLFNNSASSIVATITSRRASRNTA